MTFNRLIVFDMDDTLYLERDFVRSGYRAVSHHLEKTGIVPHGKTELLAGWLWERFLTGESRGAFDALNEHFDLGLSKSVIEDLIEAYRNHEPSISLYEGMTQLLGDLAADANTAIGLISDGPVDMQRNKFQALQLDRWISTAIFTSDLGPDCGKPSPVSYSRIMEICNGITSPNCVYVADNATKDFVAPNELGWGSICVCWPGQMYANRQPISGGTPTKRVHTIDQLRTTIHEMVS